MPIKITDFNWNQEEDTIFISLKLTNTGITLKNIDIVCTSSYLKVNSNPYIFELFLCKKINPDETSCVIKDGVLNFKLTKAVNENWTCLQVKLDKEESHALRAEALKELEELQVKSDQEKKARASSLERLAVSMQISHNEEMHKQQKELMHQEELKFFSENNCNADSLVKTDRMRLNSFCSEDGSGVASEGGYDGDEESLIFSSSENLPDMLKKKRLPTLERLKEKNESSDNESNRPSIRRFECIKMRHTPHKPDVPKRESLTTSSSQEENVPLNESETPESDMSKEVLKNEATQCFSCGDYDKAVKIYTNLLKLSPSMASLYSNRAAAYLALDAFDKAIKDCSKALELLMPPTKDNTKSRLLCHVRRGTSLVRLKDLSAGLKDFEAALRLDPNNIPLAKDAAVVKACLDAYSDTEEDETSSDDGDVEY